LSESLRIELKPQGVDLLLVSPGTTETDFYENVVHGRGNVPWPKGRGVTAAKVAEATLRAMRRGKRDIIPNFAGRWLVWASNQAPGIVDHFMVRYA
jgi:short-subunit dehydrogenase